MLCAVRDNKRLRINEDEVSAYLDMGFDIAEIGDDGKKKILKTSLSKTITYERHKAIVSGLKERIAELERKAATLEAENIELKRKMDAEKRGKKEGGK